MGRKDEEIEALRICLIQTEKDAEAQRQYRERAESEKIKVMAENTEFLCKWNSAESRLRAASGLVVRMREFAKWVRDADHNGYPGFQKAINDIANELEEALGVEPGAEG